MDNRNDGLWEIINANRKFMKCIYPDYEMASDQNKKLPQPPIFKTVGGKKIKLETGGNFDGLLKNGSYADLLTLRQSVRDFSDKPLTERQLAFLLWSAQGVKSIRGNNYASLRPVPSGGARHEFELYFTVAPGGVDGLEPGVYHYLPGESVGKSEVYVEFVRGIDDYVGEVGKMAAGQLWAAGAQVVLFLTAVIYRAEWRYAVLAHRVALIDIGHIGQNVMLSAAALGLGSCCSAAYDIEVCDKALGLDGEEEFTVLLIPVGNV